MKEQRKDSAILLITHNLAVVAETCDRVAVMYGGKIQELAHGRRDLQQPAAPVHARAARIAAARRRSEGRAADDHSRIGSGHSRPAERLQVHHALPRSLRAVPRHRARARGARAGPLRALPPLRNYRRTCRHILEVKDLHVRFPVFGGMLLRKTGEVHAVNGVSFTLAAGRNARPGRRVRAAARRRSAARSSISCGR